MLYFSLISEIGVNLSDRMYQGEYNGSKKHEADLSQVLERAWKAGLESMIITGGSLSDASQAIELSKQDGMTVIYYTKNTWIKNIKTFFFSFSTVKL